MFHVLNKKNNFFLIKGKLLKRTHYMIHRYEAAPKYHRTTIFYKQQ
jgi:hypothetical protein